MHRESGLVKIRNSLCFFPKYIPSFSISRFPFGPSGGSVTPISFLSLSSHSGMP